MGRRGPLPKRSDADSPWAIPPPEVAVGEIPAAPAGLHPEAVRAWQSFWSSDISGFVDRGGHLPALLRWIRDLDMYHRLQADLQPGSTAPGADKKRPWLGRGSRGQYTVHPTAELLSQLDQRIHRAETEFGMTPYSGVRLFGAGVQGRLTAEQLDRLIAERGDPTSSSSEPWAAGLEAVPAPSAAGTIAKRPRGSRKAKEATPA